MTERQREQLFRWACRLAGLALFIAESTRLFGTPRESLLVVYVGLLGLPWVLAAKGKNGNGNGNGNGSPAGGGQ